MNVQHMCRACFTPKTNMLPIFKEDDNDDETKVAEMLQTIVGSPILPTDNASHNICIECLTKLRESHSFVAACKRSDKTFRQLSESLVRVKRLKDPIEYVEYVINIDSTFNLPNQNTSNQNQNNANVSQSNLNRTCVNENEPSMSKPLSESENEIQSGEEEISDEMFECPACLDTFGAISVLRNHLIEVHTSEQMCIMCNNESFDDIWKHTRDHVPKKNTCNDCGKMFIRQLNLDRHSQMHTTSDAIFSCAICQIQFTSETQLQVHIRSAHRFVCQTCCKSFSTRRSLKRHEKIHSVIEDLKCNICGRQYKREDTYRIHMESHFGTKMAQELYTAQIVPHSTATKEEISNVKHSTHEYTIPSHLAGSNQELYETQSNLNLIFVGEESADGAEDEDESEQYFPFDSNRINDTMEELSSEREQYKDMNESDQIRAKAVQCEVCKKFFRDKASLRDHFTMHTGETPFSCHICDKKFRVKRNLRRHVISHSQATPYICGVCGLRFKRKRFIVGHFQTRHANCLQFPCGICNEKFEDISDLGRHWRYSHTLSYSDVEIYT